MSPFQTKNQPKLMKSHGDIDEKLSDFKTFKTFSKKRVQTLITSKNQILGPYDP